MLYQIKPIFSMQFFKLLCIILLPLNIFSQTNNNIETKVEALLEEENLTGAVWSIVSSDEIIINSSGLKNTDTKEKLKSTNAIQVGSITKSILAMGVLRLATENKLNIDDTIQEYIPELIFDNPWKESAPITIRHLLDHTSGIGDLALWHFFSTSSNPKTPLINAFKDNEKLLKVYTKPGAIFSYSNMGYSLLGMIIEKVTSKHYEAYLDENLLKPLGMNNSSFQFVSQVGEKPNKNLAMGHFEDGSTVSAVPIYLRPSAQFTTTAYDMGLFLKFMMSDGFINGKSFINPKFLNQLGSPESTIASKNGLKNGYAFGVLKKDWHNRISLSHSGNIIGYKAYYYVFKKAKKALFISYNIDHESANYSKINRLLIDYLNVPKIRSSEKVKKTEQALKNWNGYYIPVFSKVISFRLLDYLGGFTKVKVLEKGAEFMPFQKRVRNLNYSGDNLFSSSKGVEPSYLFYKDKQESYLVTTGISTIKKTNGLVILLVFISFILGVLGILCVFVHGLIHIFKLKNGFIKTPIIWSFSSIVILLLVLILLALQPFMKMGDLTLGSGLLAMSSFVLPIFSVISIVTLLKKEGMNIKSIKFWSLFCVLQFTVLLFFFEMIPFILWK